MELEGLSMLLMMHILCQQQCIEKGMTALQIIRSNAKQIVEQQQFFRAWLELGKVCKTNSQTKSQTNNCQAQHTQYFVSGRLKVVMDDDSEEEFIRAWRYGCNSAWP